MPDFASQEYWDARFKKDDKPFDWLIPAKALCFVANDMLDREVLRHAQILHIGCGTSDSFELRELVEHPAQIHNVDYSEPAVEAATKREQELLLKANESTDLLETTGGKSESAERGDPVIEATNTMNWSCMDLLSLPSTLGLLHHQAAAGGLYDIILDKSTTDSISCGPDLNLDLPYTLSINGWTRRILGSGTAQQANVHPLHVLAVHLAALTTPRKGRWIAISYSEDRFPFLPPFPHSASTGMLSDNVIKAGFPHPHQLWKLETKEKIDLDVNRDETLAERKKRLSAGLIHRPKVSHWLYVLRRTDAVVKD